MTVEFFGDRRCVVSVQFSLMSGLLHLRRVLLL